MSPLPHNDAPPPRILTQPRRIPYVLDLEEERRESDAVLRLLVGWLAGAMFVPVVVFAVVAIIGRGAGWW